MGKEVILIFRADISKLPNSPKGDSKPPTKRIEVKTDRSEDFKANLRMSARNGEKRESKREPIERKGSVIAI